MNTDIYKERELDYDKVLSELFDKIESYPLGSDERRAILNEIESFSHLANENGRLMVESEKNRLKEKELDAADIVSDEQNKTRNRELDIREQELEFQKQSKETETALREKDAELQTELRSRELDIREDELQSANSQAIVKASTDKEKIEIEDKAVKGRIIGELIGFASTALGIVGMLIGLKGAMAFERADNGGILNSKFLSQIFRIK